MNRRDAGEKGQAIPVAMVRTSSSYDGLVAPWSPGRTHPELVSWLGEGTGASNLVYDAVRVALYQLGLDRTRFGSDAWNPLGDLVPVGGRVVLKPNFIRHWNPSEGESVESVITHGSVIRAAADYAFHAVGPSGSVVVAEAPQQDCDFAEILRISGLDAMQEHFTQRLAREFHVIDLRREEVRYRDGVIVTRRPLPGDPLGYRVVDLGAMSYFHGSGLDASRFRGADYDPAPTATHHTGGRHEYLISETVLSADLVINLPKLKTHKKTGVTLALKNLVGINGDKNWLPHHCLGPIRDGGDEFPDARWRDLWRSRATEYARPLLARGRAVGLFRAARWLESATRGDAFIRAGNWHGNRTTWRMACDLNRCLYYSDRKGLRLDAPEPVRVVLTIVDGIVAGEGDGPLAPSGVPLGIVVAGTDPVAVDLACIRVMGFDERRLPKVWEPMHDRKARITAVTRSGDVRVRMSTAFDVSAARDVELDALALLHPFRAHSGWVGKVERYESRS